MPPLRGAAARRKVSQKEEMLRPADRLANDPNGCVRVNAACQAVYSERGARRMPRKGLVRRGRGRFPKGGLYPLKNPSKLGRPGWQSGSGENPPQGMAERAITWAGRGRLRVVTHVGAMVKSRSATHGGNAIGAEELNP